MESNGARTVAELFERQVRRTPGHTALICGERTLTYAELNIRANRVARLLTERGAGPEHRVVLSLTRSEELLVCLLAVTKTGAAYVPLDPDHPPARRTRVIRDARPLLILTDRHRPPAAPGETGGFQATEVPIIVLGNGLPDPGRGTGDLTDTERTAPPHPGHPAYVIHTSGSTGDPKGVVVTHAGLIHLLHAFQILLRLTPEDRLLAVTTPSFDIAGLELLLPLLGGAAVVLAGEADQGDPVRLARLLTHHPITVMQATPTLWQSVLDTGEADLTGVRALVGGEALPGPLADRLRTAAAEVTNAYGPTETTIWSTAMTLGHGQRPGPPSIGRPLGRTTAYVLDDALRRCAPGTTGELYLAGPGLARGYLGRPGLTAGRFVAAPYGPPGTRMYRTGDLARIRDDGALEFAGRTDDQVKIRGFRVELGEVETATARLPYVARAVAMLREDRPGDQRLTVYALRAPEGAPDPRHLRRELSALLPPYMVPSAIVVLKRLPLTPNGKVDRAALPAPDRPVPASADRPADAREELLARLFADVLGIDCPGPEDNFLELGGHSLLAIRLLGRIRRELGLEAGIRDFFDAPTVRGLAARLSQPTVTRPAPAPAPRPERIPLSPGQRRLWFLDRLEGRSATYVMPLELRLRGPLNQESLKAALSDLVARHESLRTVFPDIEGEPWQRILDPADAVVGLTAVETDDPTLAERQRRAFLREGFDLSTEPPLRACLVTSDTAEPVLLLAIHHIACDGWSLAVLARDLLSCYAARRAGGAGSLPSLPLQYADYTLWQSTVLGSPDRDDSLSARQLAYWRRALSGAPEELDLPTDRPRPPQASYRGGTVRLSLDAETHQGLRHLAYSAGATSFMAFQTALVTLLSRLGAGTDIPIGSPVAGRDDEALADSIGFFVNTLVLRTDASGDPGFRTLLDRVRETDLDAYANRDVPFETVVEAVNPARSLARHPLFQVLLVAQDNERPLLSTDGPVSEMNEPTLDMAKFDLSFSLEERRAPAEGAGGLDVRIEYATDLFDHTTVQRIASYLERLIKAAMERPETPISRLAVLPEEERRRLLHGWNATTREVGPATLPDLLRLQAERTPGALAVVHEGQTLTYAELHSRSNRMARLLVARGVGPETVVALVCERSLEQIVSLLGVVKSGAAYLPVDPDYPAERAAYMLQDSEPVCVITTRAMAARAPDSPRTLVVDSEGTRDALAALADADITDEVRITPLRPEHPVYVLYTSGSTGRPKGVVLPSRALVNLLAWHAKVMTGSVGTITAQFASLSFDAAAQETFSALTSGKTLAVPRDDIRKDTEALLRWLTEYRVHEIFAPMPVIESVSETARALGLGLPDLVHIAQAGEALTLRPALQEFCAAVPGRRLHNYYGPTETHVVTGCTLTADAVASGRTPPIGPPIWNTRTYVLDPALQPVPMGVPGELYLAGDQVARGYFQRPDLTAGRFVADPHGPPGTRMYRTGDLARWGSHGNLEFIGRTDFQVKIRGFRVEPGEVEAVLAALPTVAHVICVVREDRPGDKRLVAYVVARPGTVPDPRELRRAAAGFLPDYMVPSAVVLLGTLPLNPNGKVDRQALPAPDYTAGSHGDKPVTAEEKVLCRLFAEVLDVPEVGAQDSFFDLGGHSLLATRLISRIRTELRCELDIRVLFDGPTVRNLAARLTAGDGRAEVRPALRRMRPAPTGK
ncbi:amino acid adenylation domain-containing protein [Streptomyces sp. CAU 1734]|uniref:amino acid adenylation domain-containing protein n=1 Tax=Streptomyces sp. CAU 1734 TaxID=3140360 RepID=UPI003260DAC3